MPQLRLALAQVDPTLGDLAGNARIVRGWPPRPGLPARTSSRSRRWC